MISFEQCDVIVNGSGIMADSVLLGSESQMSPVQVLGNLRPIGYTQIGNFQNNLQISYYLEPRNEPIYGIVQRLKSLTGNNLDSSSIIAVGGITGNFYLESYTVSTTEHEPVKASASFISFSPLSGAIAEKTNAISYDASHCSGLAHFYSTTLMLIRNDIRNPDSKVTSYYGTANLRSLSYSFKVNSLPIFTLGQSGPMRVQLMGAEESLEIQHEVYLPLDITGATPEKALALINNFAAVPPAPASTFGIFFNPVSDIPLSSSTASWGNPFIGITSGIVKNNQIVHSVGNTARVSTVIIKNY